MFEIDYYKDENGNMPVKDFIDGLHPKMKAKVFGRIALLETYGPMLGMPFSEYLKDGIYELRTVQGRSITRVLYFFAAGKRIVLTHGFVKKTQKTPVREIRKAKAFRDDWRNRHE